MLNNDPDQYNDLDDLLRQVDELCSDDPPEAPQPEAFDEELDDDFDDDFDAGDFTPEGCADDGVVYQNYSNHYGADLRNFSNGYGQGAAPQQPQPQQKPVIPAYNADFQRSDLRQEYAEEHAVRKNHRPTMAQKHTHQAAPYQESPSAGEKKKKQRRGPGCCGIIAIVLVLSVVLGIFGISRFLFRMPKNPDAVADRKKDTATILICGADADGTRTDTMMLLYLSGSEKKAGLLSLPRDTYTITSGGNAAKLNSAYGRNGTGEEGMEGLLDYVQEIIGYRPDGYVLMSFDLVTQMVDLMGGLDVEVPMTFELYGHTIEEGMQHLDGLGVLSLLQFRSGYAMQDLGRVEVQRTVVKAAMEQWLTPGSLGRLIDALSLVQDHSIMTLSLPNCLWIGKTLLGSMKNMTTDTLPGYPDYIGGQSFYLLDRQAVADLINESYNPGRDPISADDLKIAG